MRKRAWLFCWAAAWPFFAVAETEPPCPQGGTVVTADVVAIDQTIVYNRLGANLPDAMVFALKRDVCAPGPVVDNQATCGTGQPGPGNAMLRPEQRPRPLVLRVNQGQCLQIHFENWLSSTAQSGQPATRAASIHLQGLEWVRDALDDGSWVGRNPDSLVAPGKTKVYTLYAAREGSYLLYSTGDTFSVVGGGAGDGGQLAMGLFGAVNVEPQGAEWYRSQVTEQDLCLASEGHRWENGVCRLESRDLPTIRYQAVYPEGHPQAHLPILRMDCTGKHSPQAIKLGLCRERELIQSDLTALITGPGAGRFPQAEKGAPVFNPAYALPDRLQPYREFTLVYHEVMLANQAFNSFYNELNADGNGADNFAINYGMGGIGSEILANRLGVGPMGECTTCKYEEFFLTSWAVGDPAMVVDTPANNCVNGSTDQPIPGCGATRAFYPDDPSNVYHSYISDHTKFRILHAGPDLHHMHHQHAHQWLHTPDSPNGDYTDSQAFGPGSSFTLEMVYNGSGNVNQTVGDSIFHCHFYPHFAGGMWGLWRVHDVFEAGTQLKDGKPVTGTDPQLGPATVTRALPDGEITTGTPIPAVVPVPTIPMPPKPGRVLLTGNGTQVAVCPESGGCLSNLQRGTPEGGWTNPGFPFFIPGIGGQRAPHPPMDFAELGGKVLDGGLPRHLVNACAAGETCFETPAINFWDFSKTLLDVDAFALPEDGTLVEKVAMGTHSVRPHPTKLPESSVPAEFILNGLPPTPGAPYADPCINYSRAGGQPPGLQTRKYLAADIQIDAVLNKEGWHFPQQRMLALWGDVEATLAGRRPPEPLFFRANSGECIEYTLANLVPNVYELDDFQVRTPTDILGQHIHLVKFDVTSSDGATNGFNYEDGTFSPDEVRERIAAINAGGGLAADASGQGRTQLSPATIDFFGPGPGGRWVGAQATIQRWYADPLFDGPRHDPPAPGAKDRTLRTVFTHDHFGPSTHQQTGLYAGLVIEPKGSQWWSNEIGPGIPERLGGRTATGYEGTTVEDGGPTSWQAVIQVPAPDNPADLRPSFREFVFELQDTRLTYLPFAVSPPSQLAQGFCSDNGAACTPATDANPFAPTGCNPEAYCYGYGFCSDDRAKCVPETVFLSACGSCGGSACSLNPSLSCGAVPQCSGQDATCNSIAGIPGQLVGGDPVFGPPGGGVAATGVTPWGTLPIDPPGKLGPEVISLSGGTNSFAVNYRNEPLYPRTTTAGQVSSGKAGDLSYAYASIPRPGLAAVPNPYPSLTLGVGPDDPFTPLLRAYAGDDVQIRTLIGAHINPHNFTLHGVKWLAEPSMPDSGWRASQTMGISEHFEQIFQLPPWVSARKTADYLYMGGAAAIEQAGGAWGLLRAYGELRPDLRPVPGRTQSPGAGAGAPVCPAGATTRAYTVVATTVAQATTGSSLVYNARGGGISDPNAILYFNLAHLYDAAHPLCAGGTGDLSRCPCTEPGPFCRLLPERALEPLVLRANAGDCIQVTLHNLVDPQLLGSGSAAPNLPPNQFGNLPVQAPVPACGFTGSRTNPVSNPPCLPSNVSAQVGLHPQLVTHDVTTSDGFNVGTNPRQTVAPGDPPATYTWYAGNIEVRDGKVTHIPIEFGATNLLPSDVINHYQHGLFGALIIEPAGSTWDPAAGTSTLVRAADGRTLFREHVLITQDGLANPPSALTLLGDGLNAVNYRSEILTSNLRTCPGPGLACILANAATCCTAVDAHGKCTATAFCGDPETPVLKACAGEQVRFRLLQGGGTNTNEVFELYGHVFAETPYISSGRGCDPPTTHTNPHSSSVIGEGHACTTPLPGTDLALFGRRQDSLTDWQGSRSGHGPGNHFDVLIASAGGAHRVPGDYLYRSYPSFHFNLGLWGIFRVESCKP